ncbi:PQQ-dependent sugar dehydrogenase [Alcanivorax sp. JB21]|uniref:PQQ-dependent sugar dehydrogenase n=1 Tax=Alcanivorax limicola TaxID=2874102 RepID=UPI001CBFF701|nr:PQQ-dependent sugar dehydrogenase [Alcanivorax limicola]MBZ2188713.1 PQQ-dependent sugar dehydrogenase [Alcanivorax limicola]
MDRLGILVLTLGGIAATTLLGGLSGCGDNKTTAVTGAVSSNAPDHRRTSDYHDFVVEVLASGLDHPWSIAFLPNGDKLITERSGQLRRMRGGTLLGKPLSGVPTVVAENQGGLMEVTLHPDFDNNRMLYLSYAKACDQGGATTAVGRGTLNDEGINDFQDIFVADACATGGRHHAGKLLFDRAGYLFVTVGDRGQDARAQDPSDHVGVTLRLHDDGSIPDDNPFVGDAQKADAIWSYGHRNAQGMALHPDTGEVWQHEHGPRGGDEINLIFPGLNYGWPTITHGVEYSGAHIGPDEKDGLVSPLKHWTPSIAPSGMAFYDGEAFPDWRGDIFVGALAGEHIARVRFEGTVDSAAPGDLREGGIREVEEERLLEETGLRFRDVRTGPDGLIYLLTDSSNGKLLRISP